MLIFSHEPSISGIRSDARYGVTASGDTPSLDAASSVAASCASFSARLALSANTSALTPDAPTAAPAFEPPRSPARPRSTPSPTLSACSATVTPGGTVPSPASSTNQDEPASTCDSPTAHASEAAPGAEGAGEATTAEPAGAAAGIAGASSTPAVRSHASATTRPGTRAAASKNSGYLRATALRRSRTDRSLTPNARPNTVFAICATPLSRSNVSTRTAAS